MGRMILCVLCVSFCILFHDSVQAANDQQFPATITVTDKKTQSVIEKVAKAGLSLYPARYYQPWEKSDETNK